MTAVTLEEQFRFCLTDKHLHALTSQLNLFSPT